MPEAAVAEYAATQGKGAPVSPRRRSPRQFFPAASGIQRVKGNSNYENFGERPEN